MVWRAHRQALMTAGLVLGLAAGATSALAKAPTYCVTCKNPDQVYRCKVKGVGDRASDAVKLFCIIRTAKAGNHASCKAKRGGQDCDGIAKVYNYDGPAIPAEIANDPRVQDLVEKLARKQGNAEKPTESTPPKTVVELGGRAVDASRKGLKNARSAIGGSPEAKDPVPLKAPAPPAAASAPAEAAPETATTEPALSEDADQPNRVQRAGSAVGGFARKSYRCMTSLFRNCRDEAAAEEQALQ